MNDGFDYHVFAHADGRYQTVAASPGLTPDERRALEQFIFGQTNDPEYLASLQSEPGVIWRRVGRRYGLTRVLAGQPDEAGRATLRFESIVIPHAELGRVVPHLPHMVRSAWKLAGDRAVIPAGSFRPQGPATSPELVSDAVMAIQAGKPFRRPADGATLRDVAEIIRRSIGVEGFALMFKSLAAQSPVTVNLTAPQAGERVARTTGSGAPLQVRPALQKSRAQAGVLALIAVMLLVNTTLFLVLLMRGAGNEVPPDKVQASMTNQIAGARDKTLGRIDSLGAELSALIRGVPAEVAQLEAVCRIGELATAEQLTSELDALEANLVPASQVQQHHEALLALKGQAKELLLSASQSLVLLNKVLDRLAGLENPLAPHAQGLDPSKLAELAKDLKNVEGMIEGLRGTPEAKGRIRTKVQRIRQSLEEMSAVGRQDQPEQEQADPEQAAQEQAE